MTLQVTEQVDYKKKAEIELRDIRENCHRWPVKDDIKTLKEHLSQAGINLEDIGTSEEELQACFKEGHKNSAKNWLKVARDNDSYQNIETAIGHIRDRLAEASLTLDDIGTSEKELNFLLSSHQPAQSWWHRLFKRIAK